MAGEKMKRIVAILIGGLFIYAGAVKIIRIGKAVGALQVEHDRRVLKKPRAALDLLRQLVGEGRVAQHSRANHHHGEQRALNEVVRHPNTGAAKTCKTATA